MELVDKILECKNSPEMIRSHIDNYLNSLSLGKLEEGCRAIQYLIEIELINEDTINQVKTRKASVLNNNG